jgi:twitching motility protein PilT
VTAIDSLFMAMCTAGASDLHLCCGMPPLVRKDGSMQPLNPEAKPLTPEAMDALIEPIMPEKNRKEFGEKHDTDFAYEIAGLARFRANVFMDRKGRGAVFRVIPSKILTAEQLGLSPAILQLCRLHKGLVLVTGPTGSGKSTTLAAMIDIVNQEKPVHIMTVEDPIEYLHQHKTALVNQREVGADTKSFSEALKHVLRQDPDVVLVGEMRDLETISTAVTAAETGHLVFATLHTQDAPQTIDRIIDAFPPYQQQQIRVQLSTTLQGVITQQLLQTWDGKGRVCASEVMIATPAIRNLIREGKVHQIYSSMQAGGRYGMRTMDQALSSLVMAGRISWELGLQRCHDPQELARLTGRRVAGADDA